MLGLQLNGSAQTCRFTKVTGFLVEQPSSAPNSETLIMRHNLTICTAVLALALTASAGMAEVDLTGTWQATYTAVSPTNLRGEGPRFNQAEWQLEIKEHRGNVFYGQTRWRLSGSQDWSTLQVTGNVSANGDGRIGMLEIGNDDPYPVHSVIDGQLKDGQIVVDYRSLRTGTTYSTVLERTSDKK